MKTMNYSFQYSPGIYDYIMSTLCFNEHKKEKEILEQLVRGKTCEEIGNATGYCDRTIQRRRKTLYEKTKQFMI